MLAGILVDVSGSMSEALQLNYEVEDQPVTRVQSIFSTIMNIAEQDNNFHGEEEMFVLAFGLYVEGINTCDLLSLLDYVNKLDSVYKNNGHECLAKLMEENGAPYTHKFIQEHLPSSVAGNLCKTLSENPTLLKHTVDNLPSICKNAVAYNSYLAGKDAYFAGKKAYSDSKETVSTKLQAVTSFLQKISNPINFLLNRDRYFEEEQLQKGIAESKKSSLDDENSEENIAKKYIKEALQSSAAIQLKDMIKPRQRPLHDTVNLLREVASSSDSSTSVNRHLTTTQLSNLVNAIKVFIEGDTPMCEALRYALETFQSNQYPIKVLFVLSDGEAKDGDPVQLAKQLHEHGVIVFACLLTSKQIHEPKRLYDAPDPNWSKGQCDMFAMSSVVSNESPAMEILSKNQWELPSSGQSRLFVHANDPKVIEEFSSLVRQIVESKDTLLDMLGYVSMDLYINCQNNMFDPKEQKGRTCYAYAIATVFHLTMCRIRGCEGGVPKFEDICDKLIQKYGDKPTKTEYVLKEYASFYRLRYKKIETEVEARQAINARHTLIATFRLAKEQWDAFSEFYKKNPQGILQSRHLPAVSPSTKTSGHAVVLMRCDAVSLTFMNSWGTPFANGGFFKVKDQSVLNLSFYDVYFELEDLTEKEKEIYESKCKEVAQEFAEMLPSSLRNLPYKCPHCSESSPANQFTGHLLEATCPLCNKKFEPTALGLKRSLYTR